MNDKTIEELCAPVVEKLRGLGWKINAGYQDYGAVGSEYTIDFKSPRLKEMYGIIPWAHIDIEEQVLKREVDLYVKQLLAACDKAYYDSRHSFEKTVRHFIERNFDFEKETSFEFTVDLE